MEGNSAITMENELTTDTISAGPAPVTPTDRLTPSQAHHLLPPSFLQVYFEASGRGASFRALRTSTICAIFRTGGSRYPTSSKYRRPYHARAGATA